ncbi:MAG: transglutaminase domain-containing protein [Dehalococcoidia bacterium]
MRVLSPVGGYQARVTPLWDRYVGGSGLTLSLAALVVISVAWPIQNARWVSNMPPTILIALAAVALAWALERSNQSNRSAHLTAFAVGSVVVLGSAISMTPGANGADRVLNLIREVDFWFAAWGTDEIRAGRVEFASFMLSVNWLLGYLAAWQALRNRQAWSAVLVGGIILSLALSNIGDSGGRWLAMFMGSSVLLLIHMATAQRMVRWREKTLTFDPSTVLSQSGFILVAGLLVVLAVAAFPTPNRAPLGAVADRVEEALADAEAEFSRLFNGLPSRRTYRTITYRDQVFFRGNPELTDELLFTVTGAGDSYWRAKTYTTYTGLGWETVGAEFEEFTEPAGQSYLARTEETRAYDVEMATDTFFTGGLPVSVGQPADALLWDGVAEDPLQLRFSEGRDFFAVRTGLNYQSVGSESTATARQLRGAGTDYPAWVTDTYLQLPDTLPRRVLSLAGGITSQHENNYDRVEALREFVLSYPYNLDIEAPPFEADGVDYFLFELQEGYCDYYASSLAVMLRATGIPARYVLGYAPGIPTSSGQLQVLDLHYHSWVEAYFPEFGWIVFEATPPNAIEFGGGSNPAAEAPLDADEAEELEGPFLEDEEEEVDLGSFGNESTSPISLRSAVQTLLGIVALTLGLVFYRFWWRLGRFDRADELYAKMQRLAGLLGIPRRAGQTPREYASALAGEVPDGAVDIRLVAVVYAGRRYGARPISMTSLREAENAWSRLRWVLLKKMFRFGPA